MNQSAKSLNRLVICSLCCVKDLFSPCTYKENAVLMLENPLQPPVQLHISILEIAVNAVHEPNNQKRPDQPISYGRIDGFFIGIRHFTGKRIKS